MSDVYFFRTQRTSASSSAVAMTIAPGVAWELHELRAHFSGSMAATNFTVTMDAGAGSKHDTLLYAVSAASVTDIHKTWDPPIKFTSASDEIDVAYANGSSAAYGVEVVYRYLPNY